MTETIGPSGCRVKLRVFSNQDFRFQFTLQDLNGNAYDLTGWSVSMSVRTAISAASAEFSLNSTAANANGSVITFPDAEDGEVEVYISVDDITTPAVGTYYYDIVFTDGAGDQAPLLYGSFTIIDGVTE